MLLIDGVRYQECEISNEDELEQMVIEHALDIFGGDSIYFDKKQKLKTLAGVGSIPDGLAIVFGNSPQWHIVEVELSSHDPYQHVVPQVDKFINAIDNPNTRNKIIEALYSTTVNDWVLANKIRQALKLDKDIHKFLSDLISKSPTITIIIEKNTEQLREALKKYAQKRVVEFQTFSREGVGLSVHAHLFEQLYKPVVSAKPDFPQPPTTTPLPPNGDKIEIIIREPFVKAHYLPIRKNNRQFFPGYKVPFTLETDISTIETYMSSAPGGTQVGDPNRGNYFQANLAEWYRRHPELKVGDRVRISVIELMKKYRLEIVK